MKGTCKLCKQEAVLKESHIIPRFIGKWLKSTSITGYLRMNTQMDKRAQDTAKEYWLCGDCEQLFSGWEREFANNIFYPHVEKNIPKLNYDSWLSKFCASMSWRCLTYIRSQNPKPQDEAEVALEDAAEKHLRAYLLGETDNLLQYEQHLIPLEAIQSTTMTDMPPSMNRYLLRALALDIIGNSTSKFIYTKLPSFILLGVLNVDNIKDMRSSRVALKSGQITPRQYILPAGFQGYLYDKANQMTELHRTIPQKHLDSFDKHIRANPEKTIKSKQFQAFIHDYNRFGGDVFDRSEDAEASIIKPTKEV